MRNQIVTNLTIFVVLLILLPIPSQTNPALIAGAWLGGEIGSATVGEGFSRIVDAIFGNSQITEILDKVNEILQTVQEIRATQYEILYSIGQMTKQLQKSMIQENLEDSLAIITSLTNDLWSFFDAISQNKYAGGRVDMDPFLESITLRIEEHVEPAVERLNLSVIDFLNIYKDLLLDAETDIISTHFQLRTAVAVYTIAYNNAASLLYLAQKTSPYLESARNNAILYRASVTFWANTFLDTPIDGLVQALLRAEIYEISSQNGLRDFTFNWCLDRYSNPSNIYAQDIIFNPAIDGSCGHLGKIQIARGIPFSFEKPTFAIFLQQPLQNGQTVPAERCQIGLALESTNDGGKYLHCKDPNLYLADPPNNSWKLMNVPASLYQDVPYDRKMDYLILKNLGSCGNHCYLRRGPLAGDYRAATGQLNEDVIPTKFLIWNYISWGTYNHVLTPRYVNFYLSKETNLWWNGKNSRLELTYPSFTSPTGLNLKSWFNWLVIQIPNKNQVLIINQYSNLALTSVNTYGPTKNRALPFTASRLELRPLMYSTFGNYYQNTTDISQFINQEWDWFKNNQIIHSWPKPWSDVESLQQYNVFNGANISLSLPSPYSPMVFQYSDIPLPLTVLPTNNKKIEEKFYSQDSTTPFSNFTYNAYYQIGTWIASTTLLSLLPGQTRVRSYPLDGFESTNIERSYWYFSKDVFDTTQIRLFNTNLCLTYQHPHIVAITCDPLESFQRWELSWDYLYQGLAIRINYYRSDSAKFWINPETTTGFADFWNVVPGGVNQLIRGKLKLTYVDPQPPAPSI